MTACPSPVTLGLVMISSSIPSLSITLFNAVPRSVRERRRGHNRRATFEVDPYIVGVENLEFADCKSGV